MGGGGGGDGGVGSVPDGTPSGAGLTAATYWLLDPGLAIKEGGRQLNAPPLLQWRAGAVHGCLDDAAVLDFSVWDEHGNVCWCGSQAVPFITQDPDAAGRRGGRSTRVVAPHPPPSQSVSERDAGSLAAFGRMDAVDTFEVDFVCPARDRFALVAQGQQGRVCLECALVAPEHSETGDGMAAERVVRRVTGRFQEDRPIIVRALWLELNYAFIDEWFGTRYCR